MVNVAQKEVITCHINTTDDVVLQFYACFDGADTFKTVFPYYRILWVFAIDKIM